MKFTSTRLEVFFSRGFLLCICCRSALGTVRGRPTTPTLDVPADVQHLWAQYSPFFPVAVYSSPRGCQITQVSISHIHSYPCSLTEVLRLILCVEYAQLIQASLTKSSSFSVTALVSLQHQPEKLYSLPLLSSSLSKNSKTRS